MFQGLPVNVNMWGEWGLVCWGTTLPHFPPHCQLPSASIQTRSCLRWADCSGCALTQSLHSSCVQKKPKRVAGVLSGRPLCIIRWTSAPMLTGHSSKHSTVYNNPPPLKDDLHSFLPPSMPIHQCYAFVPFLLWSENAKTGHGLFWKWDPRAEKVGGMVAITSDRADYRSRSKATRHKVTWLMGPTWTCHHPVRIKMAPHEEGFRVPFAVQGGRGGIFS